MTTPPDGDPVRHGPLHHLVAAAEWAACTDGYAYRPASLATEGFVHLSAPDQLRATAARYHADTEDLLVVTVDGAALGDLVVWEDLVGHGSFPHCYGSLPLSAVTSVEPYGSPSP